MEYGFIFVLHAWRKSKTKFSQLIHEGEKKKINKTLHIKLQLVTNLYFILY